MRTMEMRRETQAFLDSVETRQGAHVAPLPTVSAGVLFAGGSEVIIAHGPEIYHLRLTRQNRLILTK